MNQKGSFQPIRAGLDHKCISPFSLNRALCSSEIREAMLSVLHEEMKNEELFLPAWPWDGPMEQSK